jgi:dephospho-CoA kinase
MIFKKKREKTKTRPPKHINRRGGLMQPKHRAAKAYQLQRQYYTHTFNNTVLQKHINCRRSTKQTKEKNHRNFATTRKSTRSKQKYQVERILMQKISALHRPRSRKHLYKKIQMRTKSMRIPTFHHTSPTKRAVRIKSILIAAETRCTKKKTRNHTNGEEWTATKQENSSTITKEENSVTTAPS